MDTVPLSRERADAYRRAFADADRGPIAFVAVVTSDDRDAKFAPFSIGIAVANERGYTPVPIGWARFQRLDIAQSNADVLNKHLGLDAKREFEIVASTMGGRRFTCEAR